MKNVLITGGAGFIGSTFASHYIQQGCRVVAVDNFSYGQQDNVEGLEGPQFKLYNNDVRNPNYFVIDEIKNSDIIIHLAGIAPLPDCQVDPQNAYDNNVNGFLSVLHHCTDSPNKQKIIFASTSAVYENCKQIPFEDSFNLEAEPDLIYSMSKRACEHIARSFVDNYNLDITCVRFFNTYGPNQDFKRKHPPLLGYIYKCIVDNTVPDFYSNQLRDYIYVDDLIELIDLIITSPETKGDVYNACTGELVGVLDIYKVFCEEFDIDNNYNQKDPETFWYKYDSDLQNIHYPFDSARVTKEVNKLSHGCMNKARHLGWSPKIDAVTGIKKCIKYYKENN